MKIVEDTCYGYYSNDSEAFSKPPLKDLSRCLKAEKHDSCVIEPCICASRGRNPINPSDRTVGADTEQRLEVNSQSISNTLTSVQKDNLVVEPSVNKIGEVTANSQAGAVYDTSGVSQTLIAGTHGYAMGNIAEPKTIQNAHGFNKGAELSLSPTITSNSFENNNFLKEPIALDEQNETLRYETVGTLTTDGNSTKHNNRIVEPLLIGGMQKNQSVKSDGICTTLTSSMGTGGGYIPMTIEKPTYRIRKLTPLECIRLMDFDDEDYKKVKAIGMSDSQR